MPSVWPSSSCTVAICPAPLFFSTKLARLFFLLQIDRSVNFPTNTCYFMRTIASHIRVRFFWPIFQPKQQQRSYITNRHIFLSGRQRLFL